MEKTDRMVFSTDPETRRAELAEHPYTAYAATRRAEQTEERYRPRYHFTAPERNLNDPNGFTLWHGRWHLFYQAFPEGKGVHWGHAVSDDLLRWEDLPYAFAPDFHGEKECWSGGTLVEDDRVIAVYYGLEAGVVVAVSDDPMLLNWTKVGFLPLHPETPYPVYEGASNYVFDPSIWKHEGYYYILCGGSRPHPTTGRWIRTLYMYRSADLAAWEYVHPFFEGDLGSRIDDDGACPYFLPFGDRRLLLHFSHHSGGKWVIGDIDEDALTFRACNGGSFNSGAYSQGGVHAPSATADSDGGSTVIFNVNPARRGFHQIMSLPRKLTPGGTHGDLLLQAPAPDMSVLHKAHTRAENVTLEIGKPVELPASGDCLELRAVFAPTCDPVVELNVLCSPDGEERTSIRIYRQVGNINWEAHAKYGGWQTPRPSYSTFAALDVTRGSTARDVVVRSPEQAELYLAPDEPLELRVFVDKSIVEVFVNGKACLSSRVYPERADSLGVTAAAYNGDIMLTEFDAWTLGE